MNWLDEARRKQFAKRYAKQVAESEFYAQELCFFVKTDYEESPLGVYMMVGYLNNNGTRFKDLKTGQVYDLYKMDAINKKGERIGNINHLYLGNDKFVQINLKVDEVWKSFYYGKYQRTICNDECSCIMDLLKDPFFDERKGLPIVYYTTPHPGDITGYTKYLSLYELVTKHNAESAEAINGQTILSAIEEANAVLKEAQLKYKNSEASSGEAEQPKTPVTNAKENAKLTYEERDF